MSQVVLKIDLILVVSSLPHAFIIDYIFNSNLSTFEEPTNCVQ